LLLENEIIGKGPAKSREAGVSVGSTLYRQCHFTGKVNATAEQAGRGAETTSSH
jgi:hypothetical protein